MDKIFSEKINLLKALAIILVVSGHLEFRLFDMFPPYSFQLALFFFISGMLFKDKYLDRDIEENFTVIYGAACPAVLAENWFHTTKSDVAWLKSEKGQEVIVDFHSKGIADYFKLKFPADI